MPKSSYGRVLSLDSLGDQFIHLDKEARVYIDNTGKMNFSQLNFSDFQPISNYLDLSIPYGAQAANTWLFFEIYNPNQVTITAYFYPGSFDEVLFFEKRNGNWQSRQTGFLVNKSERVHPLPSICPISFSAQDTTRFVVLAKNSFGKSYFELKLFSSVYLANNPTEVLEYSFDYMLFNAFFLGALFFTALFFLIQYFQIKELAYFYYVVYLLCMLLYFLRRFEASVAKSDILFSSMMQWFYHFEIPIALLIYITYVLFGIHFLALKQTQPKGYKIAKSGVYVFGSYLIIDKLIWFGVSPESSYTIYFFARIGFIFFAIYYLYLISQTDSRLTKYFVAGTFALLIGAAISLFLSITLETDATTDLISIWKYPVFYTQVGMLFEMLFFSVGLGYKYKLSIEAKNRAILKAMNLQMNPHFIFNSLNSIGNLIRKHNTKDARKYLDNFASLLRDVLNNNQENLIDLEQELTMCQKYLKLEALRFKDRFNYVINIENSIDLNEVFLPPLTLQPYIENAIWHGLLHKEKDCQLSISMERQANGINCIIEDNGIGRKAAAALKTQSGLVRKSIGMDLTKERLAQHQITIKIIDNKNHSGKPTGTRIELFFPK